MRSETRVHTPKNAKRNNTTLGLHTNPREAQYTRDQNTHNPRYHPAEVMRGVAGKKSAEEGSANTHDEYIQREVLADAQDVLRVGGDVEIRHDVAEEGAEGGAAEDDEQGVLERADVVQFPGGAGFGESAGAAEQGGEG